MVQAVHTTAINQKYERGMNMLDSFNNYPEISNVVSEENEASSKNAKRIKKLLKQMKKNQKHFDRLLEFHEANMVQEYSSIKHRNAKENSFITTCGKGILKSLPGILIPVATSWLRSYFSKKIR